jgi:TRAP transporter TAXI family solute receptor
MYAIKQFLKTNWWMVVVVVIAFVVTFRFVDPAPPRNLTVITGSEEGRYHQVAERLKTQLARQGLEVNLITSAGSIANLEALTDGEGEVEMAFVQSGVENLFDGDTSELRSLASLYYEPIWLFYNREHPVRFIQDLEGKRVAVGEPGSGTFAVAELLLDASALKTSGRDPLVEARELGGDDAASALESGEVNAAFFVLPADSPTIKRLARNPELDFLNARRAKAYEGNYPFLSSCEIPAGLLDIASDVPDSDRILLAPLATLVVNSRFHPAHTPLILEAARSVVGGGGLLEPPDEFPSGRFTSFPLTAEAEHYHENGPPFLLRFMPFWAASLVDRLIILVIPLMVFIIPLVKIAGPLYRWRIRSKIFRWYRYLRETDQKIRDGSIDKHTEEQIVRLLELESDLRQVEVPLSYADELYDLHLHVGHVLDRLKALERGLVEESDSSETDKVPR